MREDLRLRRYTLRGRCCRIWRVGAVSLFAWVANPMFVMYVQHGDHGLRREKAEIWWTTLWETCHPQGWQKKTSWWESPCLKGLLLLFRVCPFQGPWSKHRQMILLRRLSSTAPARQNCSEKAELQTGGITKGKRYTENTTEPDTLRHKQSLFSRL